LALAALIPPSIELIVLELERFTSSLATADMCFCFAGSLAWRSNFGREAVAGTAGRWIFPAFALFASER